MIKTGAFKSTGNKWLLFTGLALAVISAALVFVYLRSAGNEGGVTVSSGPTTPVLVAAQDISAGTKITSEMLTVKSVATVDVLAGAFSDGDDLVNQITLVPIVTGEQVISAKVAGGDVSVALFGADPPVSLVIPEGMRAVSATVSNLAAAGGLARPGDYVDIVLAVQIDEATPLGSTNTIATTFLQNVQLIALDQDVTTTTIGEATNTGEGGAEGVITGSSPGDEITSPGAGTATFIVDPVHAEVLALANLCAEQYGGRLIISLRGLGEEGSVAGRTTYATNGPPPNCAALISQALP